MKSFRSAASFCLPLLVVCLMSIPLTLAFTPTSELQVLLNLYNAAFKTVIWEEDEATEGHTWDFVTTDLTDSAFNQTNPCGSSSDQTWQGITCTQASTVCTDESSLTCNILSLDLTSFNLTGTIVDDLDYLPFLTKLVLGDNNFFGTIPLTLGNLSDLKVLKLHDNNLQGSIPPTIGQLHALTLFYATSNALTHTIPAELSQLSQMAKLYLYKNHFLGSLPEHLFDNMKNLNTLLLHENSLTGSIPLGISKLTKMKIFQINDNQINGTLSSTWEQLAGKLVSFAAKNNMISGTIPTSFGSLTMLTKFDVGTNQLTHELPSFLSKLTLLKQLNLATNSFNGTIPAGFSRLTKLTSLYVKYNSLTGSMPDELFELVKLKELDVQDNSLTGTIPIYIGALTKLLELDMVNNALTGTVPIEVRYLTRLTFLSMGHNRLESTLPVEVSECVSLKTLKIAANTAMHGTIPEEYGRLTDLEEIQLFQTQFTGTIPLSFGNLTKLTLLLLYGNQLHGAIPTELGKLHQLQKLSLNGNALTSSIPQELVMNMQSLTVLVLHDNQLTGSIPESFASLKNIMYIYLYSNKMTGTVPSSVVANWTHLIQLDLNANWFSGTFPSEMGMLTALKFLRVGYNMLSGSLPDTLTRLTSLALLEFQGNLLEGKIPRGISTFQEMYFFHVEDNAFSGPLPVFSSNSSILGSLKLFSNQFTGSVPASYGNLTNLVRIVLNWNAISGTLPVTLANLKQLSIFSIKYNLLSGSLPHEFSRLTTLKALVLGTNGLTGSLEAMFPLAGNMQAMDHLDVSDNLFTGTIPSALFQLPLNVLALSINCFDGELPESICDATDTLVVFSGDGLGASPRCTSFFQTPFFGITLFNGMGGTIPSCMFESSTLQMLHLSGNGLVGTLGEVSNQSMIADLSLTHNRLRGTIPYSVQRHVYGMLDLSYNDISGTYTHGRSSNESEIILEVNRLSGNLNMAGMETINVLNILKGNFFSCVNVPENDEYFDEFSCGSSNLDNSLFFLLAAIGVAAMLFLWFLWMYRSSTGRVSDVEVESYFKRINVMTHNFSYYLAFITSRSSIRKAGHTSLDKITAFCDDLRLLTLCIFGIVLASFLFFLPLYLLKTVDDGHSSHEHQYTYLISVTYATGELSAGLVIGAWTCVIILFSSLTYILNQANSSTAKDPSARRRNISVADPSRQRGLSNFHKIELANSKRQKRLSRRGTLDKSEVISPTQSLPSSQGASLRGNQLRTLSGGSNSSSGTSADSGGEYANNTTDVQRNRVQTIVDTKGAGDDDARKRAQTLAKSRENAVVDLEGATNDNSEDDEDEAEDENLLIEMGKAILIILINLLIVGAVNSWYLQFTLGDVTPTERLIVQLSMATFKSLFAVVAVPLLASPMVNTERNILLRLLMAIFNTLLIPLAVTAFTSSSCLEHAFKESPPITTYYKYLGCTNDYFHIKLSEASYRVSCGYYDDAYEMLDVALQPFIPPFTYSYQCASVLLTSYIPVLIFVAAFQMLLPFGFVWFQIMVRYSTIPAPLRFAFYGVIWPDFWLSSAATSAEEATKEATDILVLDTNDIVYADILNQLIVLLSFGLCSPMLAAAVSLAFGFKMLMWRMLLGRFVHYRMRLANINKKQLEGEDVLQIEYDVKINDCAIDALADATVDFVSVFEMCLWPLLMSSAVFFAIISWDIAGDDVGSKASLWVPILVGGIPLFLWISFLFYKKKQVKKTTRRVAKAANRARQLGEDTETEKDGERNGSAVGIEMIGGSDVVENPINIWALKEDIIQVARK